VNNDTLSAKYIRAFIDVALDAGVLEDVSDDMQLLAVLITETPEFITVLSNPELVREKKELLVQKWLEHRVHELTLRFMKTVVRRNRLNLLAVMCEIFRKEMHTRAGICEAKIFSAIALPKELVTEIVGKLEARRGKKINASCTVNPALLGGFQVIIDGALIDCSISGSLGRLKAVLENKSRYLSEGDAHEIGAD